MDSDHTPPADAPATVLQRVMSWVVVVVLTGFAVATLYRLFTFSEPEETFWEDLFREQFPVVVGMPMAGLAALFITLVLRMSHGPLEFGVGGLRFKGGAAPIVFWVLCFMAMTTSIKMLWQVPPAAQVQPAAAERQTPVADSDP
ncbi:MAG: hypothetical protein AAGA11_00440 [Pseudomonadota bacterium]